ncbi:MAG: pdaB [Bacillales bacterium]|jgi:polysaccharide deacetylase family sporulation protein PdaB|nr:pdaB [Bacillales bacterium]
MFASLLIPVKKLKFIFVVALLAFFSALIVFANISPILPAFNYKDNKEAFFKGKEGVALTFDIGWGDENATKILDVLEKENIRDATFFLSGRWVERHQHIVERIVEQKYEIGILGYEYKDYTELSQKEIIRDVSKAIEVFNKIGIKKISLARTPTGNFDKDTLRVMNKMGLTLVRWSVDTKDWQNPGTNKIIGAARNAEDGDIILLHASDSALQTAKALPKIIEALEQNDLELTTVSKMLSGGTSNTSTVE